MARQGRKSGNVPPGRWVTLARGIRCRKHPQRKHGAQLDRYFVIRHSVDGKQIDEPLGWASDGWTETRAQAELSRLQEAKRTGKGPTTLRAEAEAHRQAEQQRAEEEAAEARRRKTVAELWDRYSKEVVAVENRPRTAAEKVRIWKGRVKPAIGSLKINDVTNEDAGKVVRTPLRLDKDGQVIGGKAEAGNVYRLLHHLFKKALEWGLRQKELGNPLETVTEPKVPRRERLLTGGEIGALLKVLDSAQAEGSEHPRIIAAIRVLILAGPRVSEALRLRWPEIRRDEMELHLADTKSGFSRRPISAATLAVLDSLERMPGVDFVFRGIKDPTRPLSYNTVEKAFRRIADRAGVQNCTPHTIRHWFSTMTANSVSNQRVGMVLTGHKSHSAYMNYVHGDKEQARALAEQLAALAGGLAAAGSNVAALRKADGAETTTLAPARRAEA
jgi:integrase